jgi:hypothetical protein
VHTFCFAPSSHSQRQQHDVPPVPGPNLLLKEVFVAAEFAIEGGFCCSNESYFRSVVLMSLASLSVLCCLLPGCPLATHFVFPNLLARAQLPQAHSDEHHNEFKVKQLEFG